MTRSSDDGIEYGPLGPGREPAKDPMKGLRGVMAGTMMMQAISFYLVLTVILRVDNGIHWTTFNWGYVTAVSTAMLILSFLQKKRWALKANIGIQVFALAGFVVHISMGIMAIIYIAVWWYLLYLRKNLIERMKRGLLTTQHL
ncbi:DUF4233 domain-containing protein [Corynebacterium pseudotuberculosis]|uniref:DUF4233 domain-containing protein n=2 Tax=Corynebacterium pseudotuberculosis TaxID=1719 RepID=D9QBX9_CORP2|nr:DUF4233 domain-containing protein [Corynebacterium pseudotuberculosis]AER69609.1 Hypothetical protein Cp106_1552 [Corynebacterium pseudotuberculosis 1/06-A]ADK29390.1 DUF4233 domain-containing protein [Corynebacterium pseudotuberculosis FRC41]ADL11055.1 DUF4233 domain-containing protein [Corynebacterium pseudotuberculosis C231]ADL21460.1 DUF4233 domain-containing protein [Corynebacterium pseudotuberculosis 1002]ADO26854.1 DUF4233 domain-containing protein [Corynebacterium pseudotuberculosis